MRVKRHELKQESLLNEYINDFDNLSHRLQLPEQQITLLNFRLNQKLKQALPIHLAQKSDDTVTFQKRKHQFTDSKTETELIELLQDI